MSSAILYLAIVAIWAVVLVPRWLRPPHTTGTLESNLAEPMAPSLGTDLAAEEDEDGGEGLPGPGDRAAARPAVPAGRSPAAAHAGPSAAERRAGILQARRRALTTLIVLTAGAVAIAMAHLAAPWVVIPPTVMLAGFVLLLREAARIDTERAQAATSRHRPQAGAEAGPQAGEPGAEIIDISARVGDQFYDQYADAEVRAVGD